MKFNEYIKLALRTEIKLKDNKERRLHAVLGLASEINEVLHSITKSNRIEEIGDVAWFTALLCDSINYPESSMDQPISEHFTVDEGNLTYIVSHLCDAVKREYIYGKVHDRCPYSIGCSDLLGWLRVYAALANTSLEAICDLNIEKLQLRYPTHFTNKASDLRDTEAEGAIFTKHYE